MDRIRKTEKKVPQFEGSIATIYTMIDALPIKKVKVASTTNITDLEADIAAGKTIDGKELVAGDPVLIKDQTNLWENGIYVVPGEKGVLERSTAGQEIHMKSAFVVVGEGTVNENKLFQCTAADFTEDTGSVVFIEREFATTP